MKSVKKFFFFGVVRCDELQANREKIFECVIYERKKSPPNFYLTETKTPRTRSLRSTLTAALRQFATSQLNSDVSLCFRDRSGLLNFRFENQIERCGLLSVRFEGREADDECGIAVVLSAFETAAEPAEGSVPSIKLVNMSSSRSAPMFA